MTFDNKLVAAGLVLGSATIALAQGAMPSVGAPDEQPDSLTVGAAEGQAAISISYLAKP